MSPNDDVIDGELIDDEVKAVGLFCLFSVTLLTLIMSIKEHLAEKGCSINPMGLYVLTVFAAGFAIYGYRFFWMGYDDYKNEKCSELHKKQGVVCAIIGALSAVISICSLFALYSD